MPPDAEVFYQLLYEQRWTTLLDFLYQHHEAIAREALLRQAAETFATAFFSQLPADAPELFSEALEKLFLLHNGGFYRLSEARFETVVEALVTLHAGRPEAAVGYARFCPENPRCAALLAQYDPPAPEPVAHAQDDDIDLAVSLPWHEADATLSLFKSQQEATFFLAVRDVFATYFVYPNVALRAVIDYEQIKDELTSEERAYFFRALIDCVVFDQHDDYRPRYFFELDSALHDTDERKEKDRRKERILALAGQTLHRIRRRAPDIGRVDFARLLREIREGEEGGF